MSDQHTDRPPPDGHTERPVLAGLAALVAVALAVGLVMGLVALAGTRVLGLGSVSAGTGSTDQRSMYLPRPQRTPSPTAAQITLGPQPGDRGGHGDGKGKGGGSGKGKGSGQKSKAARNRITLSASTTSAGPMEQFDLSGTYPGGEGAILTVQRFQDGSWVDFPASGSVGGGAFQIPVQTSQPGLNRFRVVDGDANRHSNQVRVQVR